MILHQMGHFQLNKRENDQVAKLGNSVILILNTTLYVVSFFYVKRNEYTAGLQFVLLDLTSEYNSIMFILVRVGKKAGNTHISQDGGKYWELRLILNLQM